jgi:hypothetical protein
MKKSKLSLNKFRVSKLNNLSTVIGGTGADGGGDGGTNTYEGKAPGCYLLSYVVIKEDVKETIAQ